MVPKGLGGRKRRGWGRLGFGLIALPLAAGCATEASQVRTVAFPSADGLEITADLYRGAGSEAPTVLLFHQSQSSRGEFRQVAPRLQALGYNALAVDLRWGGARDGVVNETAVRYGTPDLVPRIESGEESPWPIIDASYDDMVASLRWLDGEGYTGSRFALGSSFSAMLVYRLGAEEDLGGVLAFSPAEYDEERPSLVRSWAHALHAPALSFAAPGEEEMVAQVAEEVSVDGSLTAGGSMEGHGASVLDVDPRAWDLLTSFIGQHTGGPPGRSTHRLVSSDGVPVFVDRYAGGGRRVVALFHQGEGSARGEYGFLVPRLVEAGYDVVAADLQGGGDRFGFPNRTLSEVPQGADFTYCDAASQLRTVLDSVAAWYPDARRVAWGSSYSGALVLHAAAAGAAVDQVLAFSPASGGPMGECSANRVADAVEGPLLVVRPAGEAAIPSVRAQLALFGAAGHQVVVASPGVHGSSTLNPVRVGGDVDATWSLVEAFLETGGRRATAGDTAEIWTDGDIGEWRNTLPAAVDAWHDVQAESPVDLRSVRARVGPRFLHLQVDVGRTVTLQGLRGSLEILIDADGDPATGTTEEGYEGAEAVVVFSQPGGFAPGVGSGVGIRRAQEGRLGPLEPAGRAGVLAAPTHSSDRFEIRLERGMDLGSGPSLAADSGFAVLALKFVSEGASLDQLGPFAVPLEPHEGGEAEGLGTAALQRGEDELRVVVWNVSSGQFTREPAPFRRVLRALSPDVVLLDEVPPDATDDWLGPFFAEVAGGPWDWWLAEGGGVQRTLVASPSLPVEGEPQLGRIDYPPPVLDRWVEETDSADFAVVRAPAERDGGLSATGAWIQVQGTPVLFVPVDLQSAGFDGSPRDRLRELQAGVLRDAVSRVVDQRPEAGLVIGGDLNLVGSPRPLSTLIRGLGPGGRDLTVVRPLNVSDRSLVTWRSLGNADGFSPGRLDFVAFRAGILDVARAFVFDVDDYGADALESLGLQGGETNETSDHLPVVVDFRKGT